MSLIERFVRCGCCGEVTAQRSSPPVAAGHFPPDLDTRPNGPVRDTILTWMQHCEHCGYCAADISSIHDEAADLIATLDYQRQRNDTRFPETARPFLCHAQILARVGQFADAGWTCLHAAWVCDDCDATEASAMARGLALEYWRRARQAGTEFGEPGLEDTLVTDLLRRMGRFEDALIHCSQALDAVTDEESQAPPLIEHLLRFEKTLIQKRDSGGYRLSDLPAFRA